MHPYLHSLGVMFGNCSAGQGRTLLPLTDSHMNSWGITHGGVLMTLLDVTMANAARSLVSDERGVVTVEMKTTFLQPGGVAGITIEASASVVFQSTTMCFCEGEIRDGERLIAKASGTFKYLKIANSAAQLRRMCR
ncbi:PaaI family thioesterase [Undibacterium squillarum]|uniref:PaaI family thioesterase n=1 Tax=Undibacterium squillarum TaxID=1131567 RepID=UPI0035B043E4